MPNDLPVNTSKLRLPSFAAPTPPTAAANRLFRHVAFWTILLLWITALAVTQKDMVDFNGLFLLNLVRLPLILALTYGTTHYLVPRFLLQGELHAFLLRFGTSFLLFILLDRLLCGSPLSHWATEGTGLKWVFFNWVPLLRNAFVCLALVGMVVALKWGNLLLPQVAAKKLSGLPQEEEVKEKEATMLSVKSGTETILIPIAQIIRLHKDENYVVIHTRGRRVLVRTSLRKLEDKLPANNFVRIHRSHLVSINAVGSFTTAEVILKTGASLPLSRAHKGRLKTLFNQVV